MKTKIETAIKNWLDENIDPQYRNAAEVDEMAARALKTVVELCEDDAGRTWQSSCGTKGITDTQIKDRVVQFFVAEFYN